MRLRSQAKCSFLAIKLRWPTSSATASHFKNSSASCVGSSFHTSNEPIVFKLTLSVAISLLRRNTPSLVSDYFFVRSECFRILFVYSTDSSQQSSWKLMHSNVCVMKAHRLFSVTDQF